MSENIFLPTSWLKEVKFNIIDNENIWIIIRLIRIKNNLFTWITNKKKIWRIEYEYE